MADVTQNVEDIRAADYGEEVRESIAKGIEAINAEMISTTERQTEVETISNSVTVNEPTRIISENTRVSNETARVNNEVIRVSDEVVRVSNENLRLTQFADLITDVGNAQTLHTNLLEDISTGNTTNTNLVNSISTGNTTKTDLESAIATGDLTTYASKASVDTVTSELENIVTQIPASQKDLADVSTFIQNLLNTHEELFIPVGNYNVSNLNTGICKKIWGHGKLKSIGNAPILIINSDDVTIDGISFEGMNNVANTLEMGISINSKYFNRIDKCNFINFKGKTAVYATQTTLDHNALTVSNSTFKDNNIGIECDTRAEFIAINNNCKFHGNTCGISIKSGNVSVVGNNINDNVDGIRVLAGENDSHGIIANNNINHNTGYGLYIDSISNGETIEGNNIFQSNVYVKNTITQSIRFYNNKLDPTTLWFEGCACITLSNNDIGGGYLTLAGLVANKNSLPSYVQSINNRFATTELDIFVNKLAGGFLSCTKTTSVTLTANTVNEIVFEVLANSTAFLTSNANKIYSSSNKYIIAADCPQSTIGIEASFKIYITTGVNTGWYVMLQRYASDGTTLKSTYYLPVIIVGSYIVTHCIGNFVCDKGDKFIFKVFVPSGVTANIQNSEFYIKAINL